MKKTFRKENFVVRERVQVAQLGLVLRSGEFKIKSQAFELRRADRKDKDLFVRLGSIIEKNGIMKEESVFNGQLTDLVAVSTNLPPGVTVVKDDIKVDTDLMDDATLLCDAEAQAIVWK